MPAHTACSFLRWLNMEYMIGDMRFSIKHSAPLGVALALLAVAVAAGAARMTRDTLVLRAELAAAERRRAEIAEKKRDLARRLEEQDALEYAEYRAKATLNLKHPDEEVVVVVPDAAPAAVPPPAGLWQRFRDLLSKIF